VSLEKYPALVELPGLPFPFTQAREPSSRHNQLLCVAGNAHEFLGSVLDFDPEINVLVL
jgi:hypothetical protein